MRPSNMVKGILAAQYVLRDVIQNNIWKNTFERILENNLMLVKFVKKDLMISVIVGDISNNVNR